VRGEGGFWWVPGRGRSATSNKGTRKHDYAKGRGGKEISFPEGKGKKVVSSEGKEGGKFCSLERGTFGAAALWGKRSDVFFPKMGGGGELFS